MDSRLRTTVRNNPPATAAGLATAITSFLTALVLWAASMLPASVPVEVVASGLALVWIAISLVGAAVGKAAQTWTWPDHRVRNILSAEEFLAKVAAEERAGDPDAAVRQAAELTRLEDDRL
jgi:hypothetical protein